MAAGGESPPSCFSAGGGGGWGGQDDGGFEELVPESPTSSVLPPSAGPAIAGEQHLPLELPDIAALYEEWVSKAVEEGGSGEGEAYQGGAEELLEALLAWRQAVCHGYGFPVRNFTTSFADGRALCLLLYHYYPRTIPLDAIRQTTAHLPTVGGRRDEQEDWWTSLDTSKRQRWKQGQQRRKKEMQRQKQEEQEEEELQKLEQQEQREQPPAAARLGAETLEHEEAVASRGVASRAWRFENSDSRFPPRVSVCAFMESLRMLSVAKAANEAGGDPSNDKDLAARPRFIGTARRV